MKRLCLAALCLSMVTACETVRCSENLVPNSERGRCECPMGTSLVPIGDGGFARADGGDYLCVAPDAATPIPDAALDAAMLPDAGPVDACSAAATLCEGSCVDTTSDPAHCGRCGNTCGPGETCVDSACFDPVVMGSVSLSPSPTPWSSRRRCSRILRSSIRWLR